jgi:zinc metalloprotease ZmpB
LFRVIEDLGFPISSYFDGTTFPIPVDHRGLGSQINAHWVPNGTGGTDHMCYALCDMTNPTEPLGRAVDPWVHWHEMGGHGTLGDHVGSGLLGFAHSAGDGLAAIQNDPESALRALPERFRYAPFRPFTIERRFDRPVPAWAWGSPVVLDAMGNLVTGDDGNYGSEQILATCHFRIYRSIGGDHANVARRNFASRVVTYLILRTIGNLTAATNPIDAEVWCEEMQDTDLENWTSEGLSGGAYNKVIRWAFEEQGSYSGNPPQVDVYIDDGRSGEYQFQAVHWHNTSMWNRNSPDGLSGHQNAVSGATNYMYVKVKNRGTSAASNVVVKGYHCLPGAGLTWPVDFTAMSPAAGLSVSSIGANSSQEVTLGPFEWVPNENVYGHDCVLMIASAAGDPSNVDNFTGTETIEEWRLVPHDNNIGQRNVTIVPGGGGGEALISAIDGAVFFAGNSFNRPARMELRVEMPKVLASRGWSLDLGDGGEAFRLKPGEKRRIRLKLVAGNPFTTDDIRSTGDRDIKVDLYANDMVLGGMTYHLDPELNERSGGRRPEGIGCQHAAKDLLDCLKVSGGDKVKGVRLKNVSLDIEFGSGHDCD